MPGRLKLGKDIPRATRVAGPGQAVIIVCDAPGTRDWPLAGPIQELAPDPPSLTIVPDSPWHPEPPHPAPTVPLRPQGMECHTATEASDGDSDSPS